MDSLDIHPYLEARKRQRRRIVLFVTLGATLILLLSLWGFWNYPTSREASLSTLDNNNPLSLNTSVQVSAEQCPSNSSLTEKIFGSEAKAESFWPLLQPGSSTRFAYVFYATQKEYLCNTLINFEQLRQLKVAAEIALIYPASWQQSHPSGSTDAIRRMLDAARDKYKVNLHPLELWRTHKGDPTWSDSLTKLHVFGLTNYTRVVYLDSDGIVLRNMDHLFLAPQARIALPRAYWLEEQKLASHIMAIMPSDSLMSRVKAWATSKNAAGFDMEIVNSLSASSALILPHRGYAMLTGEFRNTNHSKYLAEDGPDAEWDPHSELSRAFYIHFSDWPLPKPWIKATQDQIQKTQPACDPKEKVECWNRKHWQGVYDLYHNLKDKVCID